MSVVPATCPACASPKCCLSPARADPFTESVMSFLRPAAPPADCCIMCRRRGTLVQHRLVRRARFFVGRAFYECRACGFAFDLLGAPVPDAYYGDNYVERYDRDSVGFAMRTSEATDFSVSLANSGLSVGCALEIGPGPGWFMEGFLAANPATRYDVVEVSAFGAEACRKAGANHVHTVNFETGADIAGLAGRYDLVVSIHSIEHFFNPLAGFANMLRCVRPGGLLYVHTPNWGNERDADWFHYAPEHLCFFGERSFRALADVLGYDVVAVVVLYDDNDVICVMRPRPGAWWALKRARLARWRREALL